MISNLRWIITKISNLIRLNLITCLSIVLLFLSPKHSLLCTCFDFHPFFSFPNLRSRKKSVTKETPLTWVHEDDCIEHTKLGEVQTDLLETLGKIDGAQDELLAPAHGLTVVEGKGHVLRKLYPILQTH